MKSIQLQVGAMGAGAMGCLVEPRGHRPIRVRYQGAQMADLRVQRSVVLRAQNREEMSYLNHSSINTDEFFYRWPAPR